MNVLQKVRIQRLSSKYYRRCVRLTSTTPEYVEEPQYPPIEDISYKEVLRNKIAKWKNKVKNLPTVEQKLMELNMPKYYGYTSYLMKDRNLYNKGNDFIRFATRTHVINGIPDSYYDGIKVDHLVEKMKSNVEDLICLHNVGILK